jgi:hypothetical protein
MRDWIYAIFLLLGLRRLSSVLFHRNHSHCTYIPIRVLRAEVNTFGGANWGKLVGGCTLLLFLGTRAMSLWFAQFGRSRNAICLSVKLFYTPSNNAV